MTSKYRSIVELYARWGRATTISSSMLSTIRKPTARISGGVLRGATYIQPGPSFTFAQVFPAISRIASSFPGYFWKGMVRSSPAKTFNSENRPPGESAGGRNSGGAGYPSFPRRVGLGGGIRGGLLGRAGLIVLPP